MLQNYKFIFNIQNKNLKFFRKIYKLCYSIVKWP